MWLESRLAMPLTPRDLLRPVEATTPRRRRRLRPSALIPTAAAVAMFVVSLWFWSTMHSPNDSRTVDKSATTSIEPTSPAELVVEDLTKKSLVVSAGEGLKDKWQLNGVTHWAGSSVLILRDRLEQTSLSINDDADLDGWIVKDIGPDYAVFAQNGEEVRLVLNEGIGY